MLLTAEQVLDGTPTATVLTVDFFDTLITRSVAQPTHVFAVMEQHLVAELGSAWSGFAVKRVRAEHDARVVAASDEPMRDVTIDEIYLAFAQAHGSSMAERRMLIEREKSTELALVKPVAFGVALVSAARARGMRIVIVSDNYMPASHIVNMAHAAGYSWVTPDDVMVSCEHGGMKHNGELWRAVIEEKSLDVAAVLHVGDDALADGTMPASFGLATNVRDVMRRSHRVMANTSPAVLPLSRIEALYRDRSANGIWPSAEVLGGGAIALLVASQIVDVMNVLKSRDVRSVQFIARDGYLAYQVWEKLRASGADLPPASYTALSRSVIWRSRIENVSEEVAHRLVGDDEVLTVERLGRRVGCELQSAKSGPLTADQARALLMANGSHIVAASRELRSRFVSYLRSVGLLNAGHHLLVDLGWTGSTMADVAEVVCEETAGATTVEGRLLGMYWDAVPHRQRVPLHGYAMNEFCGADDNVRLLGCQSLFESLITAPHGSVVGYSPSIVPEFAHTACEQRAYREVGEAIAAAALESAFRILTGTHESGVAASDISGDVAWATMMQLGHTPRRDEVELVSSVSHVTSVDHEGDGEPLIAPMPSQFVVHSELPEVYDSLMHANWVQGTLARWESDATTRWIPDEIRKLSPMFQPQWVQIP